MATTTTKNNTTTQQIKISKLQIGDKFRFSESGIYHEVRGKSQFFIDYARFNEILEQQWWFVSQDVIVFKII